MVLGCNTRGKKQEPVMNNQEDQMKSMKDDIFNRINPLKDEIINLKEIVIRNLQDKNEKLRCRFESLAKLCSKHESDHNSLPQYGRSNNVALSGIPESVSEDILEESVISVLADIDVFVERHYIEACNRFGKPDRQKSQKTIVPFVNRKNCKKVLFNKKKLGSTDCSKHNFMPNTNIFANENFAPMNESNAYICRNLKHSGLIHVCFSRDDIVKIKRQEKDRPVNVFHMEKNKGMDKDIFLDASQAVNN